MEFFENFCQKGEFFLNLKLNSKFIYKSLQGKIKYNYNIKTKRGHR